jgi:hypothetical protein
MPDDPQFFLTDDVPGTTPPRELVGYGEHPPQVEWENGARVAVQIVVNYEEGSEKTFAMGDGKNDIFYELPFELDERDLAVESFYEYGSRAGIWRPLPRLRRGRRPDQLLRLGGRAGTKSRGRSEDRRARGRDGRPRLSLEQPLRDDA